MTGGAAVCWLIALAFNVALWLHWGPGAGLYGDAATAWAVVAWWHYPRVTR